MNAQTPGKLSKFQRYRAAKKARGLKEVRLWVPDVKGSVFKAEIRRAKAYFANLEADHDLSAFSDQCLADVQGWEA